MSKASGRRDNQLKAMLDMHNEVFDTDMAQLDKSLAWYAVVASHSVGFLVVAFIIQSLCP